MLTRQFVYKQTCSQSFHFHSQSSHGLVNSLTRQFADKSTSQTVWWKIGNINKNSLSVSWLVSKLSSPQIDQFKTYTGHVLVCWQIVQLSSNSTWIVTSRHDTTHSTWQAHALWLCRARRTAQIDTLDMMSSTCSARSTVNMMSVTSATRNLVCCVILKTYDM